MGKIIAYDLYREGKLSFTYIFGTDYDVPHMFMHSLLLNLYLTHLYWHPLLGRWEILLYMYVYMAKQSTQKVTNLAYLGFWQNFVVKFLATNFFHATDRRSPQLVR